MGSYDWPPATTGLPAPSSDSVSDVARAPLDAALHLPWNQEHRTAPSSPAHRPDLARPLPRPTSHSSRVRESPHVAVPDWRRREWQAALAGLLRGRLRYVSTLQRAQAPAREELLSPATANGSWGRPTALLSVVVCWWRRAGGKVINGDGHTRNWIVEQSFACEACHYLLQLSRSFIACY